jgi:hypothetical protein
MRALLALVFYGMAAFAGLAAGYFATAPGTASERTRARAERRAADAALEAEFAKMEAAAAFLAAEERRAAAVAAGAAHPAPAAPAAL